MKQVVEKGRNGLAWYADNDLWFIIPLWTAVVLYTMWKHGYFWP